MSEPHDFRTCHVSTITEGKRSYRIALPDHDTDYIQKKIKESGQPYEPDMLRDMAQRLSKNDIVLDVGANIGNHSLYLAAVAGCRVTAFEPNAHLAAAISHSAALNKFAKRLDVVAKGVGAEAGQAGFARDIRDNLGAQSLVTDKGGIDIVTLDAMTFPAKVAALKIDVEGMETAVLRGAGELIARDRPMIYIECMDQAAFGDVLELLGPADYLLIDTFNATPTHLFLPKEKAAGVHETQAPMLRLVKESYSCRADLEKTRAALNAANLKYRDVTTQVHRLRDTSLQEKDASDRLKKELAAAQEKIEQLRAPSATGTAVDNPAAPRNPQRKPRRLRPAGRTPQERRANWILSQVNGIRVLDLGPGEKDLPFLLGREGFDVVAADTDRDVIARARARLAGEPEAVRARIRFALTPLFHRGNDRHVDTVILHRTLEHAANPARVLDLAMAHLSPTGRLIVAVPFGLGDAHDRQTQVFFPGTLFAALAPHGPVARFEIEDGVMLAVLDRAMPNANAPDLTPETLLAMTEEAMRANQVSLMRRIAAAPQGLA